MVYIKRFDEWNEVKKGVDHSKRVFMSVGEVRWVVFGVDIASELDGKGKMFTRPAVILHVNGDTLALVAPMSTKLKDVPGYMDIKFKNRDVSICLNQVKIISQKRILSRFGKLPDGKILEVKDEIKKFYDL